MCLVLLLSLGLLADCTTAPKLEPISVDRNFQIYGFTISSGVETRVFHRVIERGGRTILCGAWGMIWSDARSARGVETFLAQARFKLGGVELRRNLLFMSELDPDRPTRGQEASCIDTGVPWQTGFACEPGDIILQRWAIGS